jgi:nicotinamide/nicotinate riboside kinase
MIIGIGGVSMSGKSSLARDIKAQYTRKEVSILCQDDYIMPLNNMPLIEGKTDWENPASIDFDEFIASVVARDIEGDIVIAEGLFAFHDKSLNNLYDKKIFIEIPEPVFYERKKHDKRWEIEPEWYIQHIWPSYLKYGILPEDQKDILKFDGTKPIDIDLLMSYINK